MIVGLPLEFDRLCDDIVLINIIIMFRSDEFAQPLEFLRQLALSDTSSWFLLHDDLGWDGLKFRVTHLSNRQYNSMIYYYSIIVFLFSGF